MKYLYEVSYYCSLYDFEKHSYIVAENVKSVIDYLEKTYNDTEIICIKQTSEVTVV